MPLAWNEIRNRAIVFSKDWEDESSEDAEAKTFWDAFFNVFGITRRRIASFEVPVKKSDGKGGFVDLLWKGELLVEHKSRGKDLDKAFKQAIDYFPGIKERDLPRYVLVSDFARFRLYDLDNDEQFEFTLREFSKNIRLFGFIAGYQTQTIRAQDPVNIEAAERLGKLHDLLKESGYDGHNLEVLLVRLLFCLFAEDNTIFEKQQFRELLDKRTSEDGSDLGMWLSNLFQILNQPPVERQKSLDEQLANFAYINGRLFAEQLTMASFNRTMRETLLECTALDWSRVSPAIFGALFQSIKDKVARRNLGEHYTSEENILKALNPLFLDELRSELDRAKRDKSRLLEFQRKLATIRILDPACGCGNFLVIAYRELRLLELDVLQKLHAQSDKLVLKIDDVLFVDVDQFYGIEIEEFPAQIAQVALWMTDHQMNLRASEVFGQYLVRLPLKKSPNILRDNALTIDWKTLVSPQELNYIVGNPPFIGHHLQTDDQKRDMLATYGSDASSAGVMDYVTAWYCKAADYVRGTQIRVAFVSTNSITQGEQVGILWRALLRRCTLHIFFAHRTFKWSNEARGKAAVFCVIVGFAPYDIAPKVIYDYEKPTSEPHAIPALNINAYLVDALWVLLGNESKNLFGMPEMMYGSKPTDGGHFLFTDEEKIKFLHKEPGAKKYIKPFISAREFLHGKKRWCLWLVDVEPAVLSQLPLTKARVKAVDAFRKASKAKTTREYPYPMLFRQVTQPKSDYVVIPRHSSESRSLIPMWFMSKKDICADSCNSIPDAKLFHFGILMSSMHMAWVRYTCGRIKGDYRYSKDIVYNNFPWPYPIDKQKKAIELAAQGVLDARAAHPKSTLADLYDPVSMPPDLRKAHQVLDKSVAISYRSAPFTSEAEQVAFLFELYQKVSSPLMPVEPTTKRSAKKKTAVKRSRQ